LLQATSSTCPLRAASMSLVTSATTVGGLSDPERGQVLACSDSRAVPAVGVKREGCVPQFRGGRGAEGVGAFCILLSPHGPAAPTLPSHQRCYRSRRTVVRRLGRIGAAPQG
jgi:hypothetical protein